MTHSLSRTLRLIGAVASFSLAATAQATDLTIQGSNTVGAALAPMLVTGFLEQSGATVQSRSTSVENERQILGQTDQRTTTVLVAAHGSSTGYKAMAANNADIWAASRPVKAKEVAAFSDVADLTSPDNEHVIAIDGLAILVHPSNPIDQVSIDTLARIFSGKITNWSELGGPDRPIHVYARDNRSGTWDTFHSLVLGEDNDLVASARRYESNDRLSDDVSRDPSGIGFSGLASVRNSKLLAVSDGDAPAMKPSQLTVASEDYPLSRRLFMYTPGDRTTPMARALVAFAQSAEGQAIVPKAGFISQNPIAVKPALDASVPESFRTLTGHYRRLTVNFRFSEGRTRLDNKARRDLLRVRDYLTREGRSADELLLIGFADRQSHELRAQMISELRALSVRKALNEIGVPQVAYTGYGQYMPVGGAGSPRNGRVEVWIRDPVLE
ncbi:substrate-binding domain-containing protein [Marinobacter sp. C2H3]|uniref:substrate-binding domain-containing protein n=1 Tax=Marinobacter sp. C2H3 TaxID=3119003 RepID=UPI00300F68F1